jgi:glyoxylase-like metal-dependent hydrolase (beta-lactamase superfamily II)
VVVSSILTPVEIAGEKYSFRYPVAELVLKTDNDLIIFDTGFPEGNELTDALGALSMAPDDFTYVFNTHTHIDHYGKNRLFKNARNILSKRDYVFHKNWNEEFKKSRERAAFIKSSFPGLNTGQTDRMIDMLEAVMREHVENGLPLDEHKFHFIEDNPVIPDFVEIIETPGHTPFHVSYMIKGKNRSAVMLGDLVAGKKTFYGGKDNFIEVYSNNEQASKSLGIVKNRARESGRAVIHPSHDRPFCFDDRSYLRQSAYEL